MEELHYARKQILACTAEQVCRSTWFWKTKIKLELIIVEVTSNFEVAISKNKISLIIRTKLWHTLNAYFGWHTVKQEDSMSPHNLNFWYFRLSLIKRNAHYTTAELYICTIRHHQFYNERHITLALTKVHERNHS